MNNVEAACLVLLLFFMSNFLLAAKAKSWRLKTFRDKLSFLHGLKNPSNPIKNNTKKPMSECTLIEIFSFAVVGTRISQ